MPAAPVIRPLEAGDIDAVAAFERDIAIASFGDEAVTDLDHHRRRMKKVLEAKDDFAMVLADGATLLGWAWLGPRTNFVTHETYGDFKSFFIAQELRGTNAAFQLMNAMLEHCRKKKYPRVVGRTHSTNEAMRAVYELYRFQPTTITYELKLD